MADKGSNEKPAQIDFTVGDGNLPNDSVQVMKFSPANSQHLAVGSWDETVRVYSLNYQPPQKNLTQLAVTQAGGPVLDLCWIMNGQAIAFVTGSPNNNIMMWNLATPTSPAVEIGQHPGVLAIAFIQAGNFQILLTLGINKELNCWIHNGQKFEKKLTIPFKKIPSCMDVDLSSSLIVFGVEQDIAFYRLDNLMTGNTEVHYVDLLLKSPVNVVKIRDKPEEDDMAFNNNERIVTACGSDGRVYVGKFNLKNFAKDDLILFKAHSKKDNLYPVNAAGFSKLTWYSMYTASTDGNFYFWDIKAKNKLTVYTMTENNPITAADLSPNHKFFAFAIGYDWSIGAWGTIKYNVRPQIFIQELTERDHKREDNKK